jgi:hypothetical protein
MELALAAESRGPARQRLALVPPSVDRAPPRPAAGWMTAAGFTEPVGTRPIRPFSGGTGPARYMNRSGSHPKTMPVI